MAEINFEETYYKCLETFNNVLPKLREQIEAETEAYLKAEEAQEKGKHLAERTILIGKHIMLDQMMCFMLHEVGIEVKKDDYKKKFGKT